MTARLERIRWVDSHSAGGIWMEVQALPKSMPVTEIETVGWVLHDEPDRLIVACSRSLDGEQVGEVIAIVKPAVISREQIIAGESDDSPREPTPLT